MAVPILFGARLSRLRAKHCPKHDQFCLCSDRVRQDWLFLCYRWGSERVGNLAKVTKQKSREAEGGDQEWLGKV